MNLKLPMVQLPDITENTKKVEKHLLTLLLPFMHGLEVFECIKLKVLDTEEDQITMLTWLNLLKQLNPQLSKLLNQDYSQRIQL